MGQASIGMRLTTSPATSSFPPDAMYVAKFTIGNRLQADRLLLADQLDDRRVLHRAKTGGSSVPAWC